MSMAGIWTTSTAEGNSRGVAYLEALQTVRAVAFTVEQMEVEPGC